MNTREALLEVPSSPLFSLENCGFDLLADISHHVNLVNPTGHYKFDLSIESHREQLKTLISLGVKVKEL
jgi:hypothetical protein